LHKLHYIYLFHIIPLLSLSLSLHLSPSLPLFPASNQCVGRGSVTSSGCASDKGARKKKALTIYTQKPLPRLQSHINIPPVCVFVCVCVCVCVATDPLTSERRV